MSSLQKGVNIFLFLVSGILYGTIEGNLFASGAHIGAPDFWVFVSWYHPIMGALMLILAYAFKRYVDIPLWVLLEDMTYWVITGDPLRATSWVSMQLGGFHLFGQYLPWTYALLIILWGVFYFIRWIYRKWEAKGYFDYIRMRLRTY